ncbi:MAG TPA: helix-turn-helix transcriptional regulator [Chloroflexota bacterium]|nr:helix-turn-helix transcriptional regulator [Chloroflexota bacterium]
MEAFQEFLDNWLKGCGWTPAQLSRATTIGQNVISRWLGADPPRASPKNLAKLAPVVGVPHEELLRLVGYLPGEAQLGNVDPDLAVVNAAWPRLSQGVREAMRILANAGAAGFTSYKPWGSAFATGA